jgi:cytokinesis protein
MPPSTPVAPPSTVASAPPPPSHQDGQQKNERQTLEEIEESVHSPHLTQLNPDIDIARSQVLEALKQGPQPLEPLTALNANPLGDNLHPEEPAAPPAITVDDDGNIQPLHPQNVAPTIMPPSQPTPPSAVPPEPAADEPAMPSLDMPLPSPAAPPPQPGIPGGSPGGPPPVPPPLPPNIIHP